MTRKTWLNNFYFDLNTNQVMYRDYAVQMDRPAECQDMLRELLLSELGKNKNRRKTPKKSPRRSRPLGMRLPPHGDRE